MENYILLVFPAAMIAMMVYRAKIAKRGLIWEDCWSGRYSKNLQVMMAFGVLYHHLTQSITNYGEIDKGPITIMSNMGILFTSVFFFYSGYGLMRQYYSKEDYLDGFLYKRLSVVVVPFAVTNILYVFAGFVEGRINDVLGFFTSFFGLTLINTNAWYVVEIIIFYIAFYLAFKYVKNERKAICVVALVVFAVIAAGVLLKHDTSTINGHWFMGEWWYNTSILFVVGMIFAKNRKKIIDFIKPRYGLWLAFSAVLFIGLFNLESYVRNRFGYYHETYTTIVYSDKIITLMTQILLCISFVLFLQILTMKVRFDNPILQKASGITLEVYLIQDICMHRDAYASDMPDWMYYAIVTAVTVLAAIVLHFVNNKILGVLNEYKSGKYDENATPEAYMKNRKIKKILKRVTVVLCGFAAGLVISLAVSCYQNTIVAKRELNNNLNAINIAEIGDVVNYGHFDTNHMKMGDEPIEWIVISKDSEKALLLSKSILFTTSYNQNHEVVSYDESDIRELLSNEGTYELFTKAERANMSEHPTMLDYVFLISCEELEEVIDSNEIMKAEYTEAISRQMFHENPWWWIRGENAGIMAPLVTADGEIDFKGDEVNRPAGGIRPAIYVSLQ